MLVGREEDRALLRELTSGRHPLVGIEDFVFVEDTTNGKIVASSCLMHGRWEYDERRTEVLESKDILVLRYRNLDVLERLEDVVRRVGLRGDPELQDPGRRLQGGQRDGG